MAFLNLNPAKALKHFVGYAYLSAAAFITHHAGDVVAFLNAEAPQTVEAAANALEKALDRLGVEGVAIGTFIKSEVPKIDAAILAGIGKATPPFDAFVAAVAARLQVHGEMLLA